MPFSLAHSFPGYHKLYIGLFLWDEAIQLVFCTFLTKILQIMRVLWSSVGCKLFRHFSCPKNINMYMFWTQLLTLLAIKICPIYFINVIQISFRRNFPFSCFDQHPQNSDRNNRCITLDRQLQFEFVAFTSDVSLPYQYCQLPSQNLRRPSRFYDYHCSRWAWWSSMLWPPPILSSANSKMVAKSPRCCFEFH